MVDHIGCDKLAKRPHVVSAQDLFEESVHGRFIRSAHDLPPHWLTLILIEAPSSSSAAGLIAIAIRISPREVVLGQLDCGAR
jgi:hypothetical protein